MDIPLSSDALDLSFHPSEDQNLLAVGLISGKIQLINYDDYVSAPSSSRTPAPPQPASKKARHSIKQSTAAELEDDEEEQEKRPKLYKKIWVSRPSKKSCRGLNFSHDGASIYSISKDKSLFRTDVATGKVVDSWIGVHEAAPSRVLPIDESMVVTGDDDGVVRLWDPRKGGGNGIKPVRQWDHHFDWITDLVYLSDLPIPKPKTLKQGGGRKSKSMLKKERKRARQAALLEQEKASSSSKQKKKHDSEPESDNDDDDEDHSDDSDSDSEFDFNGNSRKSGEARSRLIVTSGDGSLSSIDLKSSGPTSFEQSQDQEDELLSITSIRSSSKLVVGTQLGILSLWTPSRGLLDHVDRVPGHPASVDTLVTLDNETVLTGSSDGLVRVVQILPSKLLGVIATHAGLPVERMKRKQSVLASIGHSNSVKFTDLSPLLEDDDDDDDDDDDEEDDEQDQSQTQALGIVGLGADDTDSDNDEEDEDADDFADLQNDDAAEDHDDDDEEEEHDDEIGAEKNQESKDSEEEEEEEEDVAPKKSKKGGKGGFFSDM